MTSQEHDSKDGCICLKDATTADPKCPITASLSNLWVEFPPTRQEGQDRTDALYNAMLEAIKLGCANHRQFLKGQT